jgi:hypothetical protein
VGLILHFAHAISEPIAKNNGAPNVKHFSGRALDYPHLVDHRPEVLIAAALNMRQI